MVSNCAKTWSKHLNASSVILETISLLKTDLFSIIFILYTILVFFVLYHQGTMKELVFNFSDWSSIWLVIVVHNLYISDNKGSVNMSKQNIDYHMLYSESKYKKRNSVITRFFIRLLVHEFFENSVYKSLSKLRINSVANRVIEVIFASRTIMKAIMDKSTS